MILLFSDIVQTDIMDLLGSDLPVESDEGLQFAWSDGILLQVEMFVLGVVLLFKWNLGSIKPFYCFFYQALKKGSWVLLDELNLAPQSVLEVLSFPCIVV